MAGTEEIDQVVATVFRGPSSPTGDDVVELSCHGGSVPARRVLETVLAAGARMAMAGEFTQRAFVNGRMDLVQAEAVADMIHARSTAGHRTAMRQLEGRASKQLASIRDELLDAAGYIELEQDFSEEDVEFADRGRLDGLLAAAQNEIVRLLGTPRSAEILRDGVRVAIAGRPNAGKSTLLNALLGFDRAIVSEIAGTTRDSIEAELEIGGFLFRFVDTAGLRDTDEPIETEGVARAKRAIDQADAVFYVVDGRLGLDTDEERELEERIRSMPHQPVIVLLNKDDLPLQSANRPQPNLPVERVVRLSATRALRDADELAGLNHILIDAVGPLLADAESAPMATNARQRTHLEAAREAIERCRQGLDDGITGDLLALELRFALSEIGALTGSMTNEDVLDRIFSRFCIGK
jgi:tRNA modification GTPase